MTGTQVVLARSGFFLILLLLVTSLASAGNVSISITTEGDELLRDCSDIRIAIDNREAVREEDQMTLRELKSPLRVRVPDSGGVQIQGTDGREVSVLACKAVSGRSEEKSRRLLSGISVRLVDGRLDVSGPGTGDWVVYLLVKVPKDASLDVQTVNGEIRLEDLNGQVEARTENGPISVRQCAGALRAQTDNGPISCSGSKGNLHLTTENGPIMVEPSASRWSGGRLVARTENGPLSLKLAAGFESGFEVVTSMHSPMSCSASQCDKASKTWNDDQRRIRFGGSDPVLRGSTVNGPVSIESAEGEEI